MLRHSYTQNTYPRGTGCRGIFEPEARRRHLQFHRLRGSVMRVSKFAVAALVATPRGDSLRCSWVGRPMDLNLLASNPSLSIPNDSNYFRCDVTPISREGWVNPAHAESWRPLSERSQRLVHFLPPHSPCPRGCTYINRYVFELS